MESLLVYLLQELPGLCCWQYASMPDSIEGRRGSRARFSEGNLMTMGRVIIVVFFAKLTVV